MFPSSPEMGTAGGVSPRAVVIRGEQVTDLFNRFTEAESLPGAVVEFGGDRVQLGL